ncbi:MAG TPA: O-antigen ligase family protein [Candidatus Acidoferrales bacterium]|nr:O-antigen ligase family protein [Candidatus Acidoferrales bacterium]
MSPIDTIRAPCIDSRRVAAPDSKPEAAPPPGSSFFDRLSFAFLLVFAAALPHSIAASQIAIGIAGLAWLGGVIQRRQPPRNLTKSLGLPMLAFVLVTVLSSLLSLEPAVSLDKLRGVALIVIVPVVAGTLRTLRQVKIVVILLLLSASATAGQTVWQKLVGRGVEVVALAPESPLKQAGVTERDTIIACGKDFTDSPKELNAALTTHLSPLSLKCRAYRGGADFYEFELPAASLMQALNGAELRRSRSIRARGTYSHFTTYAEVLMQLAALVAGLWLAYPRRWKSQGVTLALVGALLGLALASTFTRASWAALLLASLAMIWLRVKWPARLATGALALVALLAMNQLLIAKRGVGFYNPNDLSMQYRRLMWEDGVRIARQHPLLGIGMDTVKVRWKELGIRAYESMGLHSHFHSTPIQLAVERGLLGLGSWLWMMAAYVLLLLRRLLRPPPNGDWWIQGLTLGTLGATLGFLASGLLHYNFGDSEVVMLFWLLMGIALWMERNSSSEATDAARA